MRPFVHLHVHSQYSLLDGQASITKLVDKAIADGMPGIALTDHGNMFGVKEFFNYVKKKNGARKDKIKALKSLLEKLENGTASDVEKGEDEQATLAKTRAELDAIPKADFKGIIGCEVYVARRGLQYREKAMGDYSGYHLILLAKNMTGYKNLIKIVSKAYTEGFYGRPRTDRTELEKYHEGIICCSACIGGEIPRHIRAGNIDQAREAILWHKSIFGDDYYLELQLHKATVERANHETYKIQEAVNEQLIKLSRELGVKLVCTNDVHFVDEEHAEAHDRLICLGTSKDFDDPKRMLYTKQEWMKTTAEMNAIFDYIPEALDNTVEICNKIEGYSIDHAPIMPTFAIPEEFGTEEGYRATLTEQNLFDEFTRDENGNVVMSEEDAKKKIEKLGGYDKLYRIKLEADYLAKLAMDGAHKRYGEVLDEETTTRLKFELHIMKTMGFPGYFLIVQDFIRAAREELDVSVGPGRGSAAGSAVAYCLGITQIDPIKYDLLFERFLNPDRISLPDIDIDFDDDGRGRVLNWVTQKYGKEKVAHIITYGTMATKMALKDVARVQKLPLAQANQLCKWIPERIPDPNDHDKLLKINLRNAIMAVPELKEAEESNDPVMRDTIKYAKMLEGNVRGTGVHACGTIICRDDITDWVPVSTAVDKETGENMLVTQYEGSVIEDTGLIKMDFLGLKTLSIIKDAVENVKQTHGVEIDIDNIPIDDRKTYELYCAGGTIGTFQFESPGMQKYLRELQPSTFEDLIAMNALYRPGPMDYIPDFIDRKHGRKPIVYDIPIMERYLKDTYGITVYQEQVMLLSRLLGNFTRGESDTLRKAMGKKIKSKLDELKPKFIEGGISNGHDEKVLEKIWADWEKFASYAFNKSHATCYSWVAYQTAYIKAHYPSEYMATVLSRNLNDIKQVTVYMSECKSMGISVLGPDVNASMIKFSTSKSGDIRFGLAAIKGVGEAASESIVNERLKNGPYKSIYDFMERVNFSVVNRKSLESIAFAGGFDSIIDFNRSRFFAVDANNNNAQFLDMLVRYGQRVQSDKNNAQQSLFGMFSDSGSDVPPPRVPAAEDWSNIAVLNKEKEVIGLYLSGHPLDRFDFILSKMCQVELGDLDELTLLNGKELSVAGIITSVTPLTTKDGRRYARFVLEDYNTHHEFTLWSKEFEQFGIFIEMDNFLFIRGRVQPRFGKEGELVYKIQSIQHLAEVAENVSKIRIELEINEVCSTLTQMLVQHIEANPGKTVLEFTIYDHQNDVKIKLNSKKYRVATSSDFMNFLIKNEFNYFINI
ncbi:MAG: DNA polymerase III subunit alpha [Alistipes sp.]|nr:DNA polymerase III subunit alpha [Paludibacteraceae bacterium]MBO5831872.1 DNA polymerase III subunit alpha [Alistipes sp.]